VLGVLATPAHEKIPYTARMNSGSALFARAARNGARRKIPWETLDASSLPAAQRRTVGATWLERMKQEHLAVGAFSLLAQELAELGCESVVLSLVTQAATDEVRHAEICRRMAVALLGDGAVPARFRGLPRVPPHPDSSLSLRVLLHVVEMCCLSETMTGVYFSEMLARTTCAPAKAALESLLADEIDHGKAGWAYLATRVREKSVDGLDRALPAIFDRTVGRALSELKGRSDEDDPAMDAFGYLSKTASVAALIRALHGVILPGFELLGIKLDEARAHVAAQGWEA
jgi:hypothetical protein